MSPLLLCFSKLPYLVLSGNLPLMSTSPTHQQIAPLSEVSKVPGKMHSYNSVGSFGALSFGPKGLCLLLWSTTFPDKLQLNLLRLLVGLVH